MRTSNGAPVPVNGISHILIPNVITTAGNAEEVANYLLTQHEARLHAELNSREMAVGITNRSHFRQPTNA